jgi:hypothetical protein
LTHKTYSTAAQESTIVKFQVLHQSSLAVRNRPLGSFEDSIGHLIALRHGKDGGEPLSCIPSFVTKPLIFTTQRLVPTWLNPMIQQTVTTAHHQHSRKSPFEYFKRHRRLLFCKGVQHVTQHSEP